MWTGALAVIQKYQKGELYIGVFASGSILCAVLLVSVCWFICGFTHTLAPPSALQSCLTGHTDSLNGDFVDQQAGPDRMNK